MGLVGTQSAPVRVGRGSRIRSAVVSGSAWLRAALGWQLLVLLGLSVVALLGAYQVERPIHIDVGGAHETPFVNNFHNKDVAADDGTRYRWTHATSFLIFKGIGGGRERTGILRLRSGRPDGVIQPVTVLVNGVVVQQLSVGAQWQTTQFDVRGAATAGHGIVVEIRTPAEKLPTSDGRVVGVQVSQLRLEAMGGGRSVPALGTVLLALLTIVVVYLIAARALGVAIATDARRRTWAAIGGAVGAAVIVALFAYARPYIAAYIGALLAVLLGALLALLLPRPVAWLGRRCGLAVTAAEATTLCAIIALGIVVKLGGLLYPDTIVIDLGWHIRWERTFLQRQFGALYFPSDLSSGPKEWGVGVLIPKSPLFYAMLAPFTLLPVSIGTALKLVIGLLEVATAFFAFAIPKRMGMGTAGLVAAFLYTVTPLSYLALSYGNYPTLFAQFLSVVAFAILLFAGDRLDRVGVFVAFTLVLTLSLLAYPVVALFDVCVLVAFGIWRWRQATDGRAQRRAALIPVAAVVASLVAFVAYYVQYVSVTLSSLRTLGTSTTESRGYMEGGLRGAPSHIVMVFAKNIQVGNLLVLIVIAALGIVLARRAATPPGARGIWQFLLLWALIMPIFTLADAYVDLLLKPLFYTILPVAIFGGVAIVWLWRQGRAGQVAAALCCTTITAQAWLLWFHRIAYAGQG